MAQELKVSAAINTALSDLVNNLGDELGGAIIIAIDDEGKQYALKAIGDAITDEDEKEVMRETLEAATRGVDAHLAQ